MFLVCCRSRKLVVPLLAGRDELALPITLAKGAMDRVRSGMLLRLPTIVPAFGTRQVQARDFWLPYTCIQLLLMCQIH